MNEIGENKYRRIQEKLWELDRAAQNELSEDLYKLVKERLVEPMNSFFFQLHHAFVEGQQDTPKQRKKITKELKLLQ